jgi:hypothetical protein
LQQKPLVGLQKESESVETCGRFTCQRSVLKIHMELHH